MNNPYNDKSEYAVSTWMYETVSLSEALDDIARHGFTSVELWADTVHFDPRAGQERAPIKKQLSNLGLSVHSVHAPFRHFKKWTDADAFSRYRQDLWHTTIDDCSDFSVPIMVVHALDRNEYNYTKDELHIVYENLHDLCVYGEKRGVKIALENIPGSSPSSHYNDEIKCRLQDHIRNFSAIGLHYCLDIGHVGLSGAEMFDEINAADRKLITSHIHNNDGKIDAHNIPSDGIIDWQETRKYLREKGYAGQFVLEVFGGSDPFSVMKKIDTLFQQTCSNNDPQRLNDE